MNKIIIILVIFVMLFSGFTLLENSQTNNFYENNINTNNFISSNSPIYNLTIYIHNSPAGNGYYQQLFNFNSTSYFIYNLNQNASNFYISYENGTLIYSWIQNWNFTTKNLTIWSKLQNGTKVIMIEIFNQNTNLLSANGHIGEAPQLSPTYAEWDNGFRVFSSGNDPLYSGNLYWNFTSSAQSYYPIVKNVTVGKGLLLAGNITSNGGGATVSGTQFNASLHTSLNASFSNFFIQTNDVPNAYHPMALTSGTNTVSMYQKDVNGAYEINNNSYIQSSSNDFVTMYYIFFTKTMTMPTFTIELNTYNVNIKSFDKQSNPIHNYFFYNNSVYSANNNTFIFKNKTSFSTISLIPLNFSSYFTEYKNITISQSQFINNNNSYYYNLSIYYYNSNLNTVNPYDFANYIYPISILVFLLLGGIILFGTIKYRRSN